jgi:hypothetical protein
MEEVGGETLKRLFTYWGKVEFEEVISNNGFSVVDYIFRPMSEKTRWHCFFVSKA